jgi:hypothetical protein
MNQSENPLSKLTFEEIKGLLGTELKPIPAGASYKKAEKVGAIPENFDGRKQWGSCVHPIRD